MNRSRRIVILIASVIVLRAGGLFALEAREQVMLDGVAAYVDGHAITVGEVVELIAPIQAQLYGQYRGSDLDEKMAEAFRMGLRNLLDRKLILDAYERGEMRIPEKSIEARIREIQFERFGSDHVSMHGQLADAGLTLETWKRQMREGIIVSFMHNMHVHARVAISPADVRRAYFEEGDRFVVPAQAWLRAIVIRGSHAGDTVRRELADSLVSRLRGNESFERLAREYSAGRRAEAGGDWGWMDIRELRPELAAPATELSIGALSGAIAIGSDYYIVQVMGRRHERIMQMTEVYEEIERELRDRQAERLYESWINLLDARASLHQKEDVF